ncbi:MAG: hypothetical protein ABF380_11390, partial [Akkermansiaceae bacterium]
NQYFCGLPFPKFCDPHGGRLLKFKGPGRIQKITGSLIAGLTKKPHRRNLPSRLNPPLFKSFRAFSPREVITLFASR